MPALFCFRHAIELKLKSVITAVDRTFDLSADASTLEADEASVPQPPASHSLLVLERELTARLRRHNYDFLTDGHRASVARIHDLDPAGMSFRYGPAKDGSHLLPVGWEVDISKVESAVREVFDQLDLIFWSLKGFALSNPIDHKRMWSY